MTIDTVISFLSGPGLILVAAGWALKAALGVVLFRYWRKWRAKRGPSDVPVLLAATLGLSAPGQGIAMGFAECDRITHATHGDLGARRVIYQEWWSNEGVSTDVVLADCASSKLLKVRTQEERMSNRPAFDRTDRALGIYEAETAGSPVLFSLDRLATRLNTSGRDIIVADFIAEPCACAAIYPEHRGQKQPFELSK